jgi:gas vesicle protein
VKKKATMGLKDFLKNIFGDDAEKGKSFEDKAREDMQKVSEFTEKLGSEIIEKTKPAVDKLQETTEDLGKQILEKGKDFSDKAADFTERVGKKILDTSDQVWNGLQDQSEHIKKKFEQSDADSSANSMDSLFDDEPKRHTTSPKEDPIKEPFVPKEDPFKKYENSHETKSHLDALKETPGFGSSSSFFDKAEQFASGGIKQEPTIPSSDTDEPKPKWNQSISGFEDLDGDGDPLIDDAIIEEDPQDPS